MSNSSRFRTASGFLSRMVVAASLAVAGLAGTAPATASAQASAQASGISIELNKLEEQPNACRVYMLFENPGQTEFSEFQLDLVLFDTNGVIARRLSLDAAPLRAEKTSVKLFDIDGLACPKIGRILLNDMLGCADASGKRTDCLKLIKPSSRVDAKFVK
ncbi:Tat pathway signal sequence domain protein [Oceanibaculum indicum]|uniref:Tat pathway signal sequence domain protein n=1 Tax=Oceanibaculum indicum TaxID=526216 RepID=A0A420WNX3_9PROT|nr:Tat pathway signal sequence domain protein [Oceanibaculum indicum]RKQ72738.1 hypothetical protein BCL74_0506 [Oceanibaculum indicum]